MSSIRRDELHTHSGSGVMEGSNSDRTVSPSSPSGSSRAQAGPSTSYAYAHDPSTPPSTRGVDEQSDGFLGVVARWGNGGDDLSAAAGAGAGAGGAGGSRSSGARTSRMIGGRLGLSPPPPPGPPPSEPPPLPPNSTAHPFASRPRPSARLSSLASLRGTIPSRPSSPAGPPPTSELPPIPTQSLSTASRGQAERERHQRTISQSSMHQTPSPPSSPSVRSASGTSGTGPQVSPRSSSLISPQSVAAEQPSSASIYLGTPIRLGHEPLPLPSAETATTRRTNLSQPQIHSRQDTNAALGGSSVQNNAIAGPGPSASLRTSAGAGGSSGASGTRTPSRHLLQTALDLAQRAVEMDKNNDVLGALAAYREAVERLKAVMERVGVEPQADRRRRSGVGKSEEEGRTLRGIHDAYVARIQLLSSYDNSESPADSQSQPQSSTSSSTTFEQSPAVAAAVAPAAPVPAQTQTQASTSISSSSLASQSSATTASSLAQSIISGQGDRTPRPSLDEGATTGIGNLMLADQSFDSAAPSPIRPQTQASNPAQRQEVLSTGTGTPSKVHQLAGQAQRSDSTESPKLPAINGTRDEISLQDALDQAADHSTGARRGSSAAKVSDAAYSLTSTPTRTGGSTQPLPGGDSGSPGSSTTFSPSTASRIKKKGPSRPSLGLDMEADLTGVDGVEEVEMLAKTPLSGTTVFPPDMTGARRSISLSKRGGPSSPHSTREDLDRDRPLPPLPDSAPSSMDSMGQPTLLHARARAERAGDHNHGRHLSASSSSSAAPTFLVSPSTAQGTISQRRQSRTPSDNVAITGAMAEQHGSQPFPASSSTGSNRSSLVGMGGSSTSGRLRSKSQPGQRPGVGVVPGINTQGDLPPIPVASSSSGSQIRHKASASSLSHILPLSGLVHSHPSQPKSASGLRVNTDPHSHSQTLAPPALITARSHSYSGSLLSLPPLPDTAVSPSGGSLISPLPEVQPAEVLHRPFHLLRVIYASMDPAGSGSYLTGSIHISSAVWNPSNWAKSHFQVQTHTQNHNPAQSSAVRNSLVSAPKILAQDTKSRVIESLLAHLEDVRIAGQILLDGQREGTRSGGTNYRQTSLSASALGKGAEEMIRALDELDEEVDTAHKSLVKGGVGVGGWKGRKVGSSSKSWGSRISRSMDKMTNNKSLDSPDRYVQFLAQLCLGLQVIDQHLLNFTSACTPAYHALPEGSYRNIETRLRRSAEFVGAVIVPFVLDDFKQFFLRYLKGGVRYLED